MTLEEEQWERKHLMKGWEPKEFTYAKWGWSPEQIAYYEQHGDWHEADAREARHSCYLTPSFWERVKLLFGAGIVVYLRFKTAPPRYLIEPTFEVQAKVVYSQ